MDTAKIDTIKEEAVEGFNTTASCLEIFSQGRSITSSSTVSTYMPQLDFKLGEEGGLYYVDDSGQYYYQAPLSQAQIQSNITEPGITIPQYSSVKAVPSESGSDESCYVMVIEEAEEKQIQATTLTLNDRIVYEFDENEGEQSDVKVKTMVIVPQKTVIQHLCTYCDYASPKRYLLGRHMKSHSDDRPYTCFMCERAFKTRASLENHVNTHTGVRPHVCRHCHKAFTTSGEMIRHVRYKHTYEKPHKCTECDYASVELSKLKRHIRCHTGERPYQCPHCTYASPDTFKLKRHLRIHTGEKPYSCDLCHMSFTQANSLKAHKPVHSVSERPVFACELCPSTCGRKTDLRLHMQNLHTSEVPIKCQRCSKSFPDKYSFKMHRKTHLGQKCFRCDLCNYASESRRHLVSHMFRHTDEKPHQCSMCDQAFRQKQLLRRHENLYHNPNYKPPPPKPKENVCADCGRAFAHKGNLIRHMAIHDPDSYMEAEKLALKLGSFKRFATHQTEEEVESWIGSEEEENGNDSGQYVVEMQDDDELEGSDGDVVDTLNKDEHNSSDITSTNEINTAFGFVELTEE